MNQNLWSKLTIIIIAVGLASCAQVESTTNAPIRIDGSSTVYPITAKVSEKINSDNPTSPIDIKVEVSGTSGGFQRFCQGETQINDASRPINLQEMELCRKNQVAYIELPIAFDAITIVVNKNNNWVDSLTIEELKKMWQPEAENQLTTWQQIRENWPAQPLNLFAPGKDSGTYDYFTEAIMGKADISRQDYVFSEDDNALVIGVSQDTNALGYFGYSYYEQNQDNLKAVPINNGQGAVLPSQETVKNAQYQPLSRPLFIYVNSKSAQDNLAVKNFVEFYLDNAAELVSQVGYIPLTEEGYKLTKLHFERGKVGTVFDGKSELSLTMEELLRKQAIF